MNPKIRDNCQNICPNLPIYLFIDVRYYNIMYNKIYLEFIMKII